MHYTLPIQHLLRSERLVQLSRGCSALLVASHVSAASNSKAWELSCVYKHIEYMDLSHQVCSRLLELVACYLQPHQSADECDKHQLSAHVSVGPNKFE